ncbi:unnamed protein product [Aureobasidium pullulans]|nr:unnamed protein product [Aureobasidium pullulans]
MRTVVSQTVPLMRVDGSDRKIGKGHCGDEFCDGGAELQTGVRPFVSDMLKLPTRRESDAPLCQERLAKMHGRRHPQSKCVIIQHFFSATGEENIDIMSFQRREMQNQEP